MLESVFALDSTERHPYGPGILEFEKDMNYDCDLSATQTVTGVNSTNPLNPSSGTVFVKLAGRHSDEYTYAQLTIKDSQGEIIKNPAIIKEYFKNGERFDGSMVTDYNPMAYVFDSGERSSIESDPINQEFFNKTGVGYSWWAAENTVNGDYTFHAIVTREDGNDWIGSKRCAIGWDVNFATSNGNMQVKTTDLYWGTIDDVSDTISPLQQNKLGVNAESVSCKNGLVLAIKSTDRKPACITSETKRILIERGWAEPELPSDIPMLEDASISYHEAPFAFSFYSKIARGDATSNLFFSPFSISTAFSMAYEGAQGDTAEQMRKAFDFTQDDNTRRKDIFDMLERLNHDKGFYKLEVANGLWLAELHTTKQEYVDIVTTYYNGTAQTVDFVSNEGVNEINQWVREKTRDKIQEILGPGSTDELTQLVLTNSVYFNGKWSNQFNPEETIEDSFWVDNGKSVKVQMMKILAETFNYAETDTIQILEMPYLGHDISMLVLLPKDRNGLKSIEESFNSDYLNELKDMMEIQPLTVHIPKFRFETDYDLVPLLKEVGVRDAFDENNADFAGMTDDQVFLSKAVHKAFVDVNEEGTEAAAVTAAVAQLTSGPPEPRYRFIADHPFIFLIQDNETGNILFLGRVVDPTK
jgi:serpin B